MIKGLQMILLVNWTTLAPNFVKSNRALDGEVSNQRRYHSEVSRQRRYHRPTPVRSRELQNAGLRPIGEFEDSSVQNSPEVLPNNEAGESGFVPIRYEEQRKHPSQNHHHRHQKGDQREHHHHHHHYHHTKEHQHPQQQHNSHTHKQNQQQQNQHPHLVAKPPLVNLVHKSQIRIHPVGQGEVQLQNTGLSPRTYQRPKPLFVPRQRVSTKNEGRSQPPNGHLPQSANSVKFQQQTMRKPLINQRGVEKGREVTSNKDSNNQQHTTIPKSVESLGHQRSQDEQQNTRNRSKIPSNQTGAVKEERKSMYNEGSRNGHQSPRKIPSRHNQIVVPKKDQESASIQDSKEKHITTSRVPNTQKSVSKVEKGELADAQQQTARKIKSQTHQGGILKKEQQSTSNQSSECPPQTICKVLNDQRDIPKKDNDIASNQGSRNQFQNSTTQIKDSAKQKQRSDEPKYRLPESKKPQINTTANILTSNGRNTKSELADLTQKQLTTHSTTKKSTATSKTVTTSTEKKKEAESTTSKRWHVRVFQYLKKLRGDSKNKPIPTSESDNSADENRPDDTKSVTNKANKNRQIIRSNVEVDTQRSNPAMKRTEAAPSVVYGTQENLTLPVTKNTTSSPSGKGGRGGILHQIRRKIVTKEVILLAGVTTILLVLVVIALLIKQLGKEGEKIANEIQREKQIQQVLNTPKPSYSVLKVQEDISRTGSAKDISSGRSNSLHRSMGRVASTSPVKSTTPLRQNPPAGMHIPSAKSTQSVGTPTLSGTGGFDVTSPTKSTHNHVPLPRPSTID